MKKFLEQLSVHDPAHEGRTAVEFRHESWYVRETTDLLNEYNATIVMHDFPKAKLLINTGDVNFVYMLFHGPTGN